MWVDPTLERTKASMVVADGWCTICSNDHFLMQRKEPRSATFPPYPTLPTFASTGNLPSATNSGAESGVHASRTAPRPATTAGPARRPQLTPSRSQQRLPLPQALPSSNLERFQHPPLPPATSVPATTLPPPPTTSSTTAPAAGGIPLLSRIPSALSIFNPWAKKEPAAPTAQPPPQQQRPQQQQAPPQQLKGVSAAQPSAATLPVLLGSLIEATDEPDTPEATEYRIVMKVGAHWHTIAKGSHITEVQDHWMWLGENILPAVSCFDSPSNRSSSTDGTEDELSQFLLLKLESIHLAQSQSQSTPGAPDSTASTTGEPDSTNTTAVSSSSSSSKSTSQLVRKPLPSSSDDFADEEIDTVSRAYHVDYGMPRRRTSSPVSISPPVSARNRSRDSSSSSAPSSSMSFLAQPTSSSSPTSSCSSSYSSSYSESGGPSPLSSPRNTDHSPSTTHSNTSESDDAFDGSIAQWTTSSSASSVSSAATTRSSKAAAAAASSFPSFSSSSSSSSSAAASSSSSATRPASISVDNSPSPARALYRMRSASFVSASTSALPISPRHKALEADSRTQSMPAVADPILSSSEPLPITGTASGSGSSTSVKKNNKKPVQALPRARKLPPKRSNSLSAVTPLVTTESADSVLSGSLRSFHDHFGEFHQVLLGSYECTFWQESDPTSKRRGRFLDGRLYVSSSHLFFASNSAEINVKFQVPLVIIIAVEIDCVQRDSLLCATEVSEQSLLFTEMSVPACEEAYLITNWLVNHRLSRLIRDVEAHLLERTAEDMAKLEAPLPLRRPAKASSLPRTGHWWKEVRFDREAVMIAATERYYQQVFHLPLSENLLLDTPCKLSVIEHLHSTGRMVVFDHFICFMSEVVVPTEFTRLVIPLSSVRKIEQASSNPNGLAISTRALLYVFSFAEELAAMSVMPTIVQLWASKQKRDRAHRGNSEPSARPHQHHQPPPIETTPDRISPTLLESWQHYIALFGVDVDFIITEQFWGLVRENIPPALRGTVWLLLSGAKQLQATHPSEYQQLLHESANIKTLATADIERDLARTFPEHPFYQNPEGLNSMRRVLIAYSFRNPNVGYCQSMNILCGIFLLFVTEEEAYWLITAVCEHGLPDYYSFSMSGANADQQLFETIIAERMPELSEHLLEIGVPIAIVTIPWFLCLYVGFLPWHVSLRVLDCFFLDGKRILFQIGAALFKLSEPRLREMHDQSAAIRFLKNVEVDGEALFRCAYQDFAWITDQWLESRHMQHMHFILANARPPAEETPVVTSSGLGIPLVGRDDDLPSPGKYASDSPARETHSLPSRLQRALIPVARARSIAAARLRESPTAAQWRSSASVEIAFSSAFHITNSIRTRLSSTLSSVSEPYLRTPQQ